QNRPLVGLGPQIHYRAHSALSSVFPPSRTGQVACETAERFGAEIAPCFCRKRANLRGATRQAAEMSCTFGPVGANSGFRRTTWRRERNPAPTFSREMAETKDSRCEARRDPVAKRPDAISS